MSDKITRRRFMQAGAVVLAAAALTACGGGGNDTPVNPTPAKPEEGGSSKNTTDFGTLKIENLNATTTNKKFAANKKYLNLKFSVTNLTESELRISKTDFTVDPVIGVGSAGFVTKLQENAVLNAEQEIPANETVTFFAFFEITNYDLQANAMKVTFWHNEKKVVYTVKIEKEIVGGVEAWLPKATVSEVTNI